MFEFDIKDQPFNTIEHVQVWITLEETLHPYDLELSIQSPSATRVFCFNSDGTGKSRTADLVRIRDFPVCAECFRGESPLGLWSVVLKDDTEATVTSVKKIELYIDGYHRDL